MQSYENWKATYIDRDPQNITLPHWAAIKSIEQPVAICSSRTSLLLSMQWAVHNHYLCVIQLYSCRFSISNLNFDPRDSQGDTLSVDPLLRHDTNPNLKDNGSHFLSLDHSSCQRKPSRYVEARRMMRRLDLPSVVYCPIPMA